MPKPTPKGRVQRKPVDPTPFDLAIVAVVETIDGNQHLLQNKYKKFQNKSDLLTWLGIARNVWPDIKSQYRRVTTKEEKKEQIINKLMNTFGVNEKFLRFYDGAMFKSNILEDNPEVHYRTRSDIEKENDDLKTQVKALRVRVRELEKLTEQQSQLITPRKRRTTIKK